ncbi:MAG TPA: hypothetical protein VE086_05285 [Chthoniobacterales bacterium]|nr:hypothetical protein [Chthoniobacterales bacterium]
MAPDANRPLVFGSHLVGVLIVILTLLTRQAELRSTRPVGDKKQIAAQVDENGDYFARLWDDPLAKLPTFKISQPEQPESPPQVAAPPGGMQNGTDERPATSPNEPPPPAEAPVSSSPLSAAQRPAPQTQMIAQVAPSTGDSGIFIWNILDARPLPEMKERRLRTRYAIVSALAADGYLPTNESLLIPLGNPRFAYYETFRLSTRRNANPQSFQYVTLIWIPKQSSELPRVFNPDSRQAFQKEIADKAHVPVSSAARILHHGSSEDFDAYLAKVSPHASDKIVSFMRATIPTAHLQSPNRSGLEYLRRITGDDKLVPALVGELCLRIPALNRIARSEQLPRIILFTESDTSYSRAITSDVSAAVEDHAQVEVYTYLRGLDGRAEDVPTRVKSEESSKDIAASLLRGKAISEASLGTSQFDYLRRLSLYLDEEKRKRREGEICAVGILGTDIYDKMLVLQAVRPQLPAAIFFTTDLDALYLEQENANFTRNLIVASADGLDPNPSASSAGSRWKLPPMRDSYQNVLVKHIWQILEAGNSEAIPTTPQEAHLFEIVAGKNIALTPVEPSSFWGKGALAWLPIWGNVVIFLLALLNAFVILWAISSRTFEASEPGKAPMGTGARVVIYIEIAITTGFLLYLFWIFVSPARFLGEEPLSLEASVWPSITIRLLAFVVGIRLLMIASNTFVLHRARIEGELADAVPSEKQLPLGGGIVRGLTESFIALGVECTPRPRETTFNEVLSKQFDPARRRKRIMWAGLGYLAVSFVLFSQWPPAVPARGAFAFFVEKGALALGVGLYIIHLMYCLDLHVSACTLLRTLRSFYSSHVLPADRAKIKPQEMLAATSELTAIIGKTLLYPLTILILIIISRLSIFDNWTMTPSLSVTFLAGAAALILASLVLWYEGARLKSAVLHYQERKEHPDEPENIDMVNEGAFAPWHRQPIFAAFFSTAAVFGSLTVAEPLVRLFFGSS